jgi:cytochrome c peroxidase
MNKTLLWESIAALLCAAVVASGAGAHDGDAPYGDAPYGDAPHGDALYAGGHESSVFSDPTGALQTINSNGRTNTKGAFFQSLGSNGRSCASCHVADQGMSISPPQVRARFAQTHGRDPIFAAFDGANCPNGKAADAAAHSLLLTHGLIRVALPVPANAQFTVTVVHDPYGCALVVDPATGVLTLSTYRRPLPSTNLRFLSAVMFDGRESPASSPLGTMSTFQANLQKDLMQQAIDATTGHAQAKTAPTTQQVMDIVNFEMGLSTAQIYDNNAGDLRDQDALGGPRELVKETYYPGVNDVLGADPLGIAFDDTSMTLFAAWENGGNPAGYRRGAYTRREARSDIAAGEVLFNTAPLTISAVRGLNDSAALGNPVSFKGTCTSCHDAPNVGDHSLPLPLDIGTGHTPRAGFETDPNIQKAIAQLDEPDLPVFLVSGCSTPFSAAQPISFYTTDLGKATISGLCSDVNRIKGPILRGLAARAPYFHNGAAATLLQAVNFYNERFAMNLTQEQKRQLVAFLNSL